MKSFSRLFFLPVFLFFLVVSPVFADDNIFKPIASTGGSASTTASSGTALPTVSGVSLGTKVRVANGGTDSIRIKFGTTSSTSVGDTDMLVAAGTSEIFSRGSNTYFSIKSLNISVPYSVTTGEGQ